MENQKIHLKCSRCGEILDMDPDKLMAFCPFCGEKLTNDAGKGRDFENPEPGCGAAEPIAEGPSEKTMKEIPANENKDSGFEEQPDSRSENKTSSEADDDIPEWFDPPIKEKKTKPGQIIAICAASAVIIVLLFLFPAGALVLTAFLLLIYLATR